MAQFTNFATLTYTGGSTSSNTVTGELVDLAQLSKTTLADSYTPGDRVVYLLSLRNTGTVPLSGLTLSDDLGGYSFGGNTVYPLAYVSGSLRYYVGGVLQAAPTVTAGPPLQITGLTIPAGGNSLVVYETTVTPYAPLGVESGITNTATLTGPGITTGQTAQATVGARSGARLGITKALSPATVTENSRVTYTFVIENTGNTPAGAGDSIVVTDTFSPTLTELEVALNGTPWTAGNQYTYTPATGVFASTAGAITVPAATIAQNTDGTWSTTPGRAVLTISGVI